MIRVENALGIESLLEGGELLVAPVVGAVEDGEGLVAVAVVLVDDGGVVAGDSGGAEVVAPLLGPGVAGGGDGVVVVGDVDLEEVVDAAAVRERAELVAEGVDPLRAEGLDQERARVRQRVRRDHRDVVVRHRHEGRLVDRLHRYPVLVLPVALDALDVVEAAGRLGRQLRVREDRLDVGDAEVGELGGEFFAVCLGAGVY